MCTVRLRFLLDLRLTFQCIFFSRCLNSKLCGAFSSGSRVLCHFRISACVSTGASSFYKIFSSFISLPSVFKASLLVWRSQLSNSGSWIALCSNMHQQSKLQLAVEQRPGWISLLIHMSLADLGPTNTDTVLAGPKSVFNMECHAMFNTMMLSADHDEGKREIAARV